MKIFREVGGRRGCSFLRYDQSIYVAGVSPASCCEVGSQRSKPNPNGFAHTIRHWADILREYGSVAEAAVCYEEALRVYREHTETPPLDLANSLRGFALLKGGIGESERANSLWQEARSLYELVNVQAGLEESARQIARLKAE